MVISDMLHQLSHEIRILSGFQTASAKTLKFVPADKKGLFILKKSYFGKTQNSLESVIFELSFSRSSDLFSIFFGSNKTA